MAINQLTEDWNKMFDFKISLSDLKKPTHPFLYEALQSFLGNVHIDCNKLRNKMDDPGDERKFKILLLRYFNDFFQTTGFSCSILYVDLIHPESKKTIKILKFLHNYYLYFKMLTEEVVDTANKKIEEYNKLLSHKQQLQLHQEEFKIYTENQETAWKEYTKSIGKNKELLEKLKTKNSLLMKDAKTVMQQLQHMQTENITLECKVKELNPLIVTQTELNKLNKSLETANDDISTLNASEQRGLAENEIYVAEVNQVNAEIEKISKITTDNILDEFVNFREETEKLNKINSQIKETENKIEHLVEQKQKLFNSFHIMEGKLQEKTKSLTSILDGCRAKAIAMESEYKRICLGNNECAKLLENSEYQLENLKKTQSDIITKGTEAIKHFK